MTFKIIIIIKFEAQDFFDVFISWYVLVGF
jgi:hypothetical protein